MGGSIATALLFIHFTLFFCFFCCTRNCMTDCSESQANYSTW